MTTDRYKNWTPDRPSQVKTTQRVLEYMDHEDGESDVCLDLFAHEIVPRYKAPEIECGSED